MGVFLLAPASPAYTLAPLPGFQYFFLSSLNLRLGFFFVFDSFFFCFLGLGIYTGKNKILAVLNGTFFFRPSGFGQGPKIASVLPHSPLFFQTRRVSDNELEEAEANLECKKQA